MWQSVLTFAFALACGLGLLLLVAQSFEQPTGDAASRGYGRAFALLGFPFLALGLLVFLLTQGHLSHLFATLLVCVPLFFFGATLASARYGYLLARYRESPGRRLKGRRGKRLGQAIERGDLAQMQALIADGAEVNAAGPRGDTPLCFALKKEQHAAARLLLESGADATLAPRDGTAPLMELSCSDAFAELLEVALRRGASPDFAGDFGLPILQNAIGCRAEKSFHLILAAGARLDLRAPEHDVPAPLVFALRRRLWAMARALVERGAPLHDVPGDREIERAIESGEPPREGGDGAEDYSQLVLALAHRGFRAPGLRPAEAAAST